MRTSLTNIPKDGIVVPQFWVYAYVTSKYTVVGVGVAVMVGVIVGVGVMVGVIV